MSIIIIMIDAKKFPIAIYLIGLPCIITLPNDDGIGIMNIDKNYLVKIISIFDYVSALT